MCCVDAILWSRKILNFSFQWRNRFWRLKINWAWSGANLRVYFQEVEYHYNVPVKLDTDSNLSVYGKVPDRRFIASDSEIWTRTITLTQKVSLKFQFASTDRCSVCFFLLMKILYVTSESWSLTSTLLFEVHFKFIYALCSFESITMYKGVIFKLNCEYQEIFENLKAMLVKQPLLVNYDDNIPLILNTDPSNYGVE